MLVAGTADLTYMSIYDELQNLVNERRLFFLSPALPGSLVRRKMYITPQIRKLIMGPWTDPDWEERCGDLRADIDHFVEGKLLTVAAKSYKGHTSQLKRLEPAKDEVWEIRSRDPKPSIRVFGRFADKDLFVALNWRLRVDLGKIGTREWRNARLECKTEWKKLFLAYEPKSGDHLHDYISNIVLV